MVLLIVFGTRAVTYTTRAGEFSCPSCGDAQAYRLRRVRRFFAVYFVPLVPLARLGEYVECEGCGGTFDVEILSGDRAAGSRAEERFLAAALRVMVSMMLADGHVDDAERDAIAEVYERLSGEALDPARLDAEISAIEGDAVSVTDQLGALLGHLNDARKDALLRAALGVAAADGRIDALEALLLREIGAALEVRPARVREIVREVET